MALLQWRVEFNTGIASVDYEHQRLFEIINALLADVAATEEFMAALHDRIAAHFALEERIMRERGYGGYAEHKADHERLVDDLRDLMEEHRSGEYVGAVDRLSERLERCFSAHFSTLDVRLHRAIGDA
jgi:hemerythrin